MRQVNKVAVPGAGVMGATIAAQLANAEMLQETAACEIECFLERLASPEAHEALQAFMERRKPDFSKFN